MLKKKSLFIKVTQQSSVPSSAFHKHSTCAFQIEYCQPKVVYIKKKHKHIGPNSCKTDEILTFLICKFCFIAC